MTGMPKKVASSGSRKYDNAQKSPGITLKVASKLNPGGMKKAKSKKSPNPGSPQMY